MLPRLSSLSFSYRERSCEIAHLTFYAHFSEFEVAMYLNKAVVGTSEHNWWNVRDGQPVIKVKQYHIAWAMGQ